MKAASIQRRTIATPLRWTVQILLAPLRLFLAVRRSMTGASVVLLLVAIVSVNIIWGYPWTGVFAACVTMLIVGWGINRVMHPKLQISFVLPNSAPAQQPFSLTLHLKNQSRLPAMDLSVGFAAAPIPSRFWSRRHQQPLHQVLDSPQLVDTIHPAQRTSTSTSLVYSRRGVHPLPDVLVTSMFPFHLFRSAVAQPSGTEIAITPRPLSGEEDVLAGGLVDALGSWSHQLLAGDALEYTGSREYEIGMPVRRWDFASWARLGRPIVREYQSPSIRMVTLLVDTSIERPTLSVHDSEQLLERVLSLAATAIHELARKAVRIRLFVTSELPAAHADAGLAASAPDAESLLIRLASAQRVPGALADARGNELLELTGRTPTLVLTSRAEPNFADANRALINTLRVDLPVDPPPAAPHRHRRSEATAGSLETIAGGG